MKKKILAFAIGAVMTLALASCGKEISDEIITIKEYKGLKVGKVTPIEVTDEDVEMSIQSTLQTRAIRPSSTNRGYCNDGLPWKGRWSCV